MISNFITSPPRWHTMSCHDLPGPMTWLRPRGRPRHSSPPPPVQSVREGKSEGLWYDWTRRQTERKRGETALGPATTRARKLRALEYSTDGRVMRDGPLPPRKRPPIRRQRAHSAPAQRIRRATWRHESVSRGGMRACHVEA